MIEVKNLEKTFIDGGLETPVLKGVNLAVANEEFVAIMGRSGAGKSTLLHQIGLLDEPTKGEIRIDGCDTRTMTMTEKTTFRLKRCGYVFQDYALLPDLTARENVMLPLLMQGMLSQDADSEACAALEKVGLDHRLDNLPSKLSGGEQQRVSIARATAHEPSILFADEPTANLDSESAQSVLDIFNELHAHGQTIFMVTHERTYARAANRILYVDDGLVVKEERLS